VKLDPRWRAILKRAWSVRLLALAFVLTAAEVVLPLFADEMPRGTFAVLTGLAVGGAFVARITAQKDLD
jgi:hypothetical protein